VRHSDDKITRKTCERENEDGRELTSRGRGEKLRALRGEDLGGLLESSGGVHGPYEKENATEGHDEPLNEERE
jgi:hypothetical protein